MNSLNDKDNSRAGFKIPLDEVEIKEKPELWRKMIGEGYIWDSRVEYIRRRYAAKFLWVFFVSVLFDITINVVFVQKVFTQTEKASMLERFVVEPIVTTLTLFDSPEKSAKLKPRPVYNPDFFQKNLLTVNSFPQMDKDGKPVVYDTKADMQGFISDQIASLNKSGVQNIWPDQAYNCKTFDSFNQLIQKLDGSQIYCKKGKSGNLYVVGVAAEMASKVGSQTYFSDLRLRLGVFHKSADSWGYYDLITPRSLPVSTLRVYPEQITPSLSMDFPELVRNNEVSK